MRSRLQSSRDAVRRTEYLWESALDGKACGDVPCGLSFGLILIERIDARRGGDEDIYPEAEPFVEIEARRFGIAWPGAASARTST